MGQTAQTGQSRTVHNMVMWSHFDGTGWWDASSLWQLGLSNYRNRPQRATMYRNWPQRGQIVTIYHNGHRFGHNGTAKRSGYKLKPSDSKTYLITEKHSKYKLYTVNVRKCQSQSRHICCKNQHQT